MYKAWIEQITPLVYDNSKSIYEILSELIPILLNLKNNQNEFSTTMDNFYNKLTQKINELNNLINDDKENYNNLKTSFNNDFTKLKNDLTTEIANISNTIVTMLDNRIKFFNHSYTENKEHLKGNVDGTFTQIVNLINQTYNNFINQLTNIFNEYFDSIDIKEMLYNELISSDLNTEYRENQVTPWIEIKTYLPDATEYSITDEQVGDIVYIGKKFHFTSPDFDIYAPSLEVVTESNALNRIPIMPNGLYKYKNHLFIGQGNLITFDSVEIPEDGHEYYYKGWDKKDQAHIYYDNTTRQLVKLRLNGTITRYKLNIASNQNPPLNNNPYHIVYRQNKYYMPLQSVSSSGDDLYYIYSSTDLVNWNIYDLTFEKLLLYGFDEIFYVVVGAIYLKYIDDSSGLGKEQWLSGSGITLYGLYWVDKLIENDITSYKYYYIGIINGKISLFYTTELITKANINDVEKTIVKQNTKNATYTSIYNNRENPFGSFTQPYGVDPRYSYEFFLGHMLDNEENEFILGDFDIYQTLNATSIFLPSVNKQGILNPLNKNYIYPIYGNSNKQNKVYSGVINANEGGCFFKIFDDGTKLFWISPASTKISSFHFYQTIEELMI